MQVVGGADASVGAIPTAFWEGPTARIVERRANGRRSTDQRSDDRRRAPESADTTTPQPEAAPAPARNLIIGISLLAFACGIALATAANRMAHSANVRIAQIERDHASAPPAPPAPATAAAPPAIVVQPLAEPAAPPVEPEPVATAAAPAATEAPVVAATAVAVLKARPAPHPAIAKAAPAPRAASARAVHPRRPAAATSATSPDPFEEVDGPAAPRTPRKWVDPFAE
jgi:hypothetical protein